MLRHRVNIVSACRTEPTLIVRAHNTETIILVLTSPSKHCSCTQHQATSQRCLCSQHCANIARARSTAPPLLARAHITEPTLLVLKVLSQHCSCSKHLATIIARAQSTEPTLLVLKAPSQTKPCVFEHNIYKKKMSHKTKQRKKPSKR